ncbi:hypothetical protein [Haloarcula sp. Atlit-7R]|uniref:hypothetical protein n=1 Tax=Haloarcula sp. Atlit-7R TaxID=2282125 RepID=UPI000EF13F87|nr:hypothetical protein [Haloarcula sp. Atlit-7R]RLM95093.1 hypothetical protein D3D01_15075 [Haloarcula sp. Atlit-7R]
MSRLGTAYLRTLQALGQRIPYGTTIYERNWDVLIVLDACRADLLQTVASDTELFNAVSTVRSVGSSSSEWLENTFPGHPETAHTVMVTGNTWTDRYLDADAFAVLDEVWKYAWDEDLNTVPAEAVTDRAIALARRLNPERLVVHYMQPHHPFVPDPLDSDGGLARTGHHSNTANPWVALRRGDISPGRVWDAYEANLRYVLREVEALAENVDGHLAVTADHGNLFGEWGLYGHPMYTPVPALLAVPWAETDGVDGGGREPDLRPPEPLPVSRVYGSESDSCRLKSLGYL